MKQSELDEKRSNIWNKYMEVCMRLNRCFETFETNIEKDLEKQREDLNKLLDDLNYEIHPELITEEE